MIKLDYTIDSPEERKALVEKILEETPNPTPQYLEILADYLVLCMEKQERKERRMLTENRMATINKRETSFEGLVSQFENGEDGIYNLITENKNIIFQPKITITKKDVEEIPFLKQIREAIKFWEEKAKTATGRNAFIIKQAIIALRKDQYVVKESYRRPIAFKSLTHSRCITPLNEDIVFDENGFCKLKNASRTNPIISCIDPVVCSAVLCNYSKLKMDSYGDLEKDTWFFMMDFDDLCGRALKDYPLYEKIVEMKIDGKQNVEIQQALMDEFDTKHSLEYISSLWRKKIPNLIASEAEDEYLNWYYLTKEKGKYKKCSRCGEIKLAHNKYFSKNKTSKDGFYSICKCCRNKKKTDSGQE